MHLDAGEGMDTSTSVRHRVFATAVLRLGTARVGAFLSLTQGEVLQYAEGDIPIPDSLWAMVLRSDSGLIYGPTPPRSKTESPEGSAQLTDESRVQQTPPARPATPHDHSATYPPRKPLEPTQPGYTHSQPENFEEATPRSAKGRSSPA